MQVIAIICFKQASIRGNNLSFASFFTRLLTLSSRNPYLVDIYKELLPLYINYINKETGTHLLQITRSYTNFFNRLDGTDGPCTMDGYLMFLFAIIVRNIRRYGGGPSGMPSELVDTGNSGGVHIPSTRELLIEAIRLSPWNWSSWLELIEEYCSMNDNRIPTWNDIMGMTTYFSFYSYLCLHQMISRYQ